MANTRIRFDSAIAASHFTGNAGTDTRDSSTESAAAVWKAIKDEAAKQFGAGAVSNWLSRVSAESLSPCEIKLVAETRFVKDWVQTHYLRKMQQISAQVSGRKILFTVAARPAAETPEAHAPARRAAPSPAAIDDISSPVNKHMTFENFVTGASNRMMFEAVRSLCEEYSAMPGYGSLYIHAPVGMGKTHLLHAAAQYLREETPERKIVYLSAEKFMYRYVSALREKDMMTFKDSFRSVDVLLIDDIQFMCGKESTQEEFYHTVISLLDNRKRVIVAGDRAPSDLEGLHERLRSRFTGAPVVTAARPDESLRRDILERKRETLVNADISDDILALLAENIHSSVRELEGALYRLAAHSALMREDITEDKARVMLKDLLAANTRSISVQDIQKKVCDYFSITQADLMSARRTKNIVIPRQTAMYLAKKLTNRSFSEIGRRFKKKDHTTVIHAVNRVEERIKDNGDFRADIERLEASLLQ